MLSVVTGAGSWFETDGGEDVLRRMVCSWLAPGRCLEPFFIFGGGFNFFELAGKEGKMGSELHHSLSPWTMFTPQTDFWTMEIAVVTMDSPDDPCMSDDSRTDTSTLYKRPHKWQKRYKLITRDAIDNYIRAQKRDNLLCCHETFRIGHQVKYVHHLLLTR